MTLAASFDLGVVVTPIINAASYGLISIGLLTAFIQAERLLGPGSARNALPGLGAGLGAMAVGVILRPFASSSSADSATNTSRPADVPEPLPEPGPVPDPTADLGDGFDPLILLTTVGALCALGLAVLAGFSVRRSILDRREERRVRERDWSAARAVYIGVLDDYAAYLADPYAWLDRPILEDVEDPSTAAFLDALGAAQFLDLDVVPTDSQRVQRFRLAATNLRAAWDKADAKARRIGAAADESVSRRKLHRAARALRTALDESATPEERESAAAAVHRLTAGLVVAPQRILEPISAAIATARRGELAVGPTR